MKFAKWADRIIAGFNSMFTIAAWWAGMSYVTDVITGSNSSDFLRWSTAVFLVIAFVLGVGEKILRETDRSRD